MMIESKSNHSFIIMNTDGGVSRIYKQKKKSFYLIVFTLKASKNLSLIMIEIYSTKNSMSLKIQIKR